jgi:hypothetical protein
MPEIRKMMTMMPECRMMCNSLETTKVIVQGAGLDVINGVYVRDGIVDGAGRYVKKAIWNGVEDTFSLFRCNVSNNTQHWFISIVPVGAQPGTNADTDFYSAPVSDALC